MSLGEAGSPRLDLGAQDFQIIRGDIEYYKKSFNGFYFFPWRGHNT